MKKLLLILSFYSLGLCASDEKRLEKCQRDLLQKFESFFSRLESKQTIEDLIYKLKFSFPFLSIVKGQDLLLSDPNQIEMLTKELTKMYDTSLNNCENAYWDEDNAKANRWFDVAHDIIRLAQLLSIKMETEKKLRTKPQSIYYGENIAFSPMCAIL